LREETLDLIRSNKRIMKRSHLMKKRFMIIKLNILDKNINFKFFAVSSCSCSIDEQEQNANSTIRVGNAPHCDSPFNATAALMTFVLGFRGNSPTLDPKSRGRTRRKRYVNIFANANVAYSCNPPRN